MTRSLEARILELEDEYINDDSFRNSVQAVDGQIIRLDKTLWDASPVLKKHLVDCDSYKVLAVPEGGLSAMQEAHRSGVFPADFSTLLNILAAAAQLELRELTQQCFNAMKRFVMADYPLACSTEAVMLFFKMLVESPLRTFDIYKQQLTKIADHCSKDRAVMIDALNLVKERIERFNLLNLEPIPISFGECRLPIAILKRAGKLHTAVLSGEDWKPVELFGKHFDLENHKIEDFFRLEYGSYVLYKSGINVCRKNLRAKSYPELILEGCTYFLTRGKFTFAVVEKDNNYCILQWVDDDEFVSIYTTDIEIVFIEFDCNQRLLAVQLSPGETFVFMLREKCLLRMEWYGGGFIAMQFQEKRRVLFKWKGEESKLNVYEFLEEDDPLPKGVVVGSARGRPIISGENIFILDDQGLNLMRKLPNDMNITMVPGEYQALSELWMSS